MAKPTEFVSLRCPICGITEEAPGQVSYSTIMDNKGEIHTWLGYNSSIEHDCEGLSPEPMEKK